MPEHDVGDFVGKPPKNNRQASTRVDKYDMDQYAVKAQERPGVAILAGKDIPFKYSNALRVRRRDPYLTKEGQIKVTIESTGKRTRDNTDRLVDVYFVWHKFPTT